MSGHNDMFYVDRTIIDRGGNYSIYWVIHRRDRSEWYPVTDELVVGVAYVD